jgi:hypothetical protein
VTFYLQFDDDLKKFFLLPSVCIFLNMTRNCHKSQIESQYVQLN